MRIGLNARAGKAVLLLLLVAPAAVLAWFCVDNLNHYWESNNPPSGAAIEDFRVVHVDYEEYCGRTSRSTSTCVEEVTGLDFVGPDGRTHHADVHPHFSPGDAVEAFQDSDGDWQVRGGFSTPWVLRTAGFTGAGALALLAVAVPVVRST